MAITSARTDRTTVRTSESPRFRPLARLRDVLGYRQILMNLVRKDLKVKYTQSVLGIFWSMLNPVLYLIVFSFVAAVLQSNIPAFPVYLLSGLVAWNLFSGSLALAARSVVDNTSLVKKIYFPKEILPLASVGTSIVDFGLQSIVLIAFMIIFRYHFFGWNVLLLPLAFVGLVLFTTTVSIWVSALNVRYRDTQHLLNLILLAWFWLTPIVYPAGLLQDKLGALGFKVYLVLNPVGDIVMAFQRALYAQVQPAGAASPVLASLSVGQLALVMVWVIVLSTLLLLAAWRSFFRLSGDFAEDL